MLDGRVDVARFDVEILSGVLFGPLVRVACPG